MFTSDQKKAHDFSRHVSVTANAGSGKTSVLVSRFCDILLYNQKLEIHEVAAITFTEKAAGEIKLKIAKELESRYSNPNFVKVKSRLKDLRENLNSGVITTIHGFCSQMLKEFPLETKAPPSFIVLKGYDRNQMISSSIDDCIEKALSNNIENLNYELNFNMVRNIGREQLDLIINFMIGKREDISFSNLKGVLKLDKVSTLDLWESQLKLFANKITNSQETIDSFNSILQFTKDDVNQESQYLFESIIIEKDFKQLIENVSNLSSILLTQKGTLKKSAFRKTITNDEFDFLSNQSKILSSNFSTLLKVIGNTDSSNQIHSDLFDYKDLLLNIYNSVVEEYSKKKNYINGLDFDDLQMFLFNSLQDSDSKRRMKDRFKFIMVDEFQDTNEIQYSIVYNLLNELNVGKLCIVGDRKQSIYGFRNADVTVFTKAQDNISSFNIENKLNLQPLFKYDDEIKDSTAIEKNGIISLKASFRLLPSICAFVNESCKNILQPKGFFNYGVENEPLVCARNSEGLGKVEFLLSKKIYVNSAYKNSKVEIDLTSIEDSDTEIEVENLIESELIAKRILELIYSNDKIVWELDKSTGIEKARKAEFKDIAILCRKRITFVGLEKAFRKYGIPYITNGSGGFYGVQEIYDVINYLRVIVNPHDLVALLGVFRSPFFSVSDSELFRISNFKINNSGYSNSDFWTKAKFLANENNSEPSLKRAVSFIESDILISSRLPVHQVIKLIIEKTGFRGSLLNSDRGNQKIANIDKLIELAREFSNQGFKSLYDFTVQVTDMINLKEQESEADSNFQQDVVKILTIHSSKGLEFPIVIIPSMESPPSSKNTIFFDKELGFGFNWIFEEKEFMPSISSLIKYKQSEKELAEEARLFYVATTRAKDILIMSGTLIESKEGILKIQKENSMLAWALAPFNYLPYSNETLQLFTGELKFLNETQSSEVARTFSQDVNFIYHIDEQVKFEVNNNKLLSSNPEIYRIEEIAGYVKGDVYSASQFQMYSLCPTKYYLKYRLGLTEDILEFENVNYSLIENKLERSFSKLFKTCASEIDEMLTDEDIINIVEVAILKEQILNIDLSKIKIMLTETFKNILQDEYSREVIFGKINNYKSNIYKTNRELRMAFGDDYILSLIDRTITDSLGNISILLYKFQSSKNQLNNPDYYLTQIKIYGYFISKLVPEQEFITIKILYIDNPISIRTYNFTKTELLEIETDIQIFIENIRDVSYFGNQVLSDKSNHCPDCYYNSIEGCIYRK